MSSVLFSFFVFFLAMRTFCLEFSFVVSSQLADYSHVHNIFFSRNTEHASAICFHLSSFTDMEINKNIFCIK